MRLAIFAIAASTLMSAVVQAQEAKVIERVVIAGRLQQIGHIIAIDPNCQPIARPDISLIQEPNKGKVTVEQIKEFAIFPPTNPRSKCNDRKVPSNAFFYKTSPSANGDDYFEIEFIDFMGGPHRLRYHVTIRQN